MLVPPSVQKQKWNQEAMYWRIVNDKKFGKPLDRYTAPFFLLDFHVSQQRSPFQKKSFLKSISYVSANYSWMRATKIQSNLDW